MTFVCVLVSQPVSTMPSQFANGTVHAPTAQVPLTHAGVPFVVVHRLSHRPHEARFVWTSTQAPRQHSCGAKHGREALHPGTQALPTQSVLGGQCSLLTHS